MWKRQNKQGGVFWTARLVEMPAACFAVALKSWHAVKNLAGNVQKCGDVADRADVLDSAAKSPASDKRIRLDVRVLDPAGY